MDLEQIHEIRASRSQELVLGREDFKERIEKMTQRQTRPRVEEGQGIYYIM